jgi:hypothetical protein
MNNQSNSKAAPGSSFPALDVHASESSGFLQNARVRLDVSASGIKLSARSGDAWREVLRRTGQNELVGGVARVRTAELPELEATRLETSACLVVRGKVPEGTLSIAFWLTEDDDWIDVTETVAFEGDSKRRAKVEVAELSAEWELCEWREPGEVFSPHLVPKDGDVIGRHTLRSPALTAESDGIAAALINDVDLLTKQQALPGFMNLTRRGERPVFQSGLIGQEVRGHVYFKATGEAVRVERLFHGYALHVQAQSSSNAAVSPNSDLGLGAAQGHAARGTVLTAARRRLWARFGSRNLKRSAAPRATVSELARECYPRVLDLKWREAEIDGRRIGAVATNRAFPGDVWMCPWFHNLSSAYGLHTFGQRLGNAEWVERALAAKELHLAAPLENGLFPTLFTFETDGKPARWDGSHVQGGGLDAHHVGDMSYTLFWLLLFHRELEADVRIVELATQYFEALSRLARPDGGLPAYVDRKTQAPVSRIDMDTWRRALAERPGGDRYIGMMLDEWGSERFVESAEDAFSLMFLAELLKLPELDAGLRARVRTLAERVAAWVIERVVKPAWYITMEVHWSCAPQALGYYDARSGQHPQDAMAIWAAADGLLRLFETTNEPWHLEFASRALDRLCLHQQIYDPPFLGFDGFGGYPAQNIDGEWSDARQALFAITHLEFHRVTGDPEQLERAIAACRAGFSTLFHPAITPQYPVGWARLPVGFAAENHAHSGVDQIAGVSSFHWGTGSALMAAAYLLRRGIDAW